MVAVGGREKRAGIGRREDLASGAHSRDPGEGALRRARSDALPEYTRYADTGCEVHPSCLSCPLVRCRYDEPGGSRRLLSEGRDRSIVAMRQAGAGFEEIASRFGVSRRTVFRVLARSGPGEPGKRGRRPMRRRRDDRNGNRG